MMSITAIGRRFDEVLERVHLGEEIVVTRRGVPLGRLLPPADPTITDPMPDGSVSS